MATPGGFTQPPLRGYTPYGELDPTQEKLRACVGLEIPFWEGCDLPYCRSPNMPGAGGAWVVPTLLNSEGTWANRPVVAPVVSHTGPKGGSVGWNVWAKHLGGTGGQGLLYSDALDPVASQFAIGANFSVLMVGMPMVYLNPDTAPSGRGDTMRVLWQFKDAAGNVLHSGRANYELELFNWRFFGVDFYAQPPVVPFYGKRVSLLFVNGEEGGTIPSPRLFVGTEDGEVLRLNFTGMAGTYPMLASRHLYLFLPQTGAGGKETACGGGCWEHFSFHVRSFEEDEARVLCRDALGLIKWDPYVVRRTLWVRVHHQLSASPSIHHRVAGRPGASPRVIGGPSIYSRDSARPSAAGPRVAAAPSSYQRISARVRIADQEADMQATPLCPSEVNWLADNILDLADVTDDLQVPPTDITSADGVTCEIWDVATGLELTVVSPVTLNQVGSTSTWRGSFLASVANGFTERQRLRFVFLFDGGVGLQGRFVALGVVASATS